MVTDVKQFHEHYKNTFNTGDAKALAALYEENGIFIKSPEGDFAKGRKEIEATALEYMKFGKMSHTTRFCYVVDDLAQMSAAWEINGTAPDGTTVHEEGRSADLLHRGSDGYWRLVVDNPYGGIG